MDDGTLNAVRRLAAGVAHELNNPLTVLQLRADLLLEAAELDEDLRTQLDVLRVSTGRIARIVRALHQLARPPEDRTVVALGVVVEAATRMVHDEGPDVPITAGPVPGAVLGDHDGLVYAVHQALRYAVGRGPVAIAGRLDGGRVVLTLSTRPRPEPAPEEPAGEPPPGLTLAVTIAAAHEGRLEVHPDRLSLDLPAILGAEDPRRSGSAKN